MRGTWTKVLVAGLMSVATFAFTGRLAAQEPSPPSSPPNQAGAASGRPGRAGNVENRLENLSKLLNLSNEQKEKIRPLLQHEMERMRQVRNNTSLTQGEARQRLETIRRNTNRRIAEILTPEQKKHFQEIREERRGGRPEGDQSGPGSTTSPATPPAPQSPPNPN